VFLLPSVAFTEKNISDRLKTPKTNKKTENAEKESLSRKNRLAAHSSSSQACILVTLKYIKYA